VKSSVVKKCAVYSHHHNTGKFCDSDVKCKSLNIVPVCGVVVNLLLNYMLEKQETYGIKDIYWISFFSVENRWSSR
jgi:hypothetical protein